MEKRNKKGEPFFLGGKALSEEFDFDLEMVEAGSPLIIDRVEVYYERFLAVFFSPFEPPPPKKKEKK